MSFNESTQIKPASLLEVGDPTRPGEFDPTRHIGPVVAHELNNILTIVQGYADRLLLRHGANPTIMTELIDFRGVPSCRHCHPQRQAAERH